MQRPDLKYDASGTLINPSNWFDPSSIKPGDLMEYVGVKRPEDLRDIFLILKIDQRTKYECWAVIWDLRGKRVLVNCVIYNSLNILLASAEQSDTV